MAATSPEQMSNSILPRMTGMTMMNEKLATSSLLLPSSSPVAMVDPDRERPGSVAAACARPMTKALPKVIPFLARGLAK